MNPLADLGPLACTLFAPGTAPSLVEAVVRCDMYMANQSHLRRSAVKSKGVG